MANTVSILSYANTFGNWLTTTNELANEINTLGSGNYTKDTGLLVLNGAGTGLQVSNNALFTSNVIITGAGQALQVTNDAIISGNLTVLGNTTISLNELVFNDITSNTLHSNIASLLTANVINDLGVTGNLYASQIITLGGITANTVTINTISTASTANVGGDLGVTGNTYIHGNLTVTGNTNLTIENVSMNEIVAGNLVVNGTISGNGATLLQSDILSAALALSVALG
jgi:hypothetical protein